MNIHKELQEELNHSIERDRISHALLFSGKCGYGTLPLALWYAGRLLCTDDSEKCKNDVMSGLNPDLHFVYPVTTTGKVPRKPTSKDYISDWRDFIAQNKFADGFAWLQHIGADGKQGLINVEQSKEILKNLSLRSYAGGYKVMIIWLPETLNISASNKLLKIIEEPPQKTVIIMISEKAEELLPTILSRCQLIRVPSLSQLEVEEVLVQQFSVDPNLAEEAAAVSQGDVSLALESLLHQSESFETLFIQWVRNAFRAKKDVTALVDIYDWSQEIAAWNDREKHKQFLSYCADIFRQALVQSYGAPDLVLNQIKSETFKWDGFANFIHGSNIEDILNEINDASYHIERNGNAKIIFLDMGIKMTRFIHKKEPNPAS